MFLILSISQVAELAMRRSSRSVTISRVPSNFPRVCTLGKLGIIEIFIH